MLQSLFFDQASSQPDAPALWVAGQNYSYAELAQRARRVAAALTPLADGNESRCLLFAYRSVHAYAAMLGILDAGMAYVPLHPKFPAARNAEVIERSGAGVMVVDKQGAQQLEAILPYLTRTLHIVVLDEAAMVPTVLSGRAIVHALPADHAGYVPRPVAADQLAYVLFTSGSTGAPKGVMTSHANVLAYVAARAERYPTAPGGRFSQCSDLTFDASTHDIYTCWDAGGCLYVPSVQDAIFLAGFIREHAITHWASVPSVLALMQQFRKVSEGAFPSLQMTVLGGEALPKSLALTWLLAAPNTRIVSDYGPTETTVAVMTYEVTAPFLADDNRTAVPLGSPYQDVEYVVADPQQRQVEAGEHGELLIGGPQVGRGYLCANSHDMSRFFERSYPGRKANRWYRTGDAVSDSAQGVLFHGRLDTQVKIRGHRIELQEVEEVVLSACQTAQCAVVAWPLDNDGKPTGLVAFVQATPESPSMEAAIRRSCQQRLPPYARPEQIVCLESLPININGKIDRKQLLALCEKPVLSVRRASRQAHAPAGA